MDQDLDTRLELAAQALALVSGLLTREDWVMLVWSLDWSDLAVTSTGQVMIMMIIMMMMINPTGQVILTGLDKLTPVDRSLLEAGEERQEVCNQECFTSWRSEVMMFTPRGQPGRGCSAALQQGDMMYRDLCSNVLQDTAESQGLLHSAGTEVSNTGL